MTQDEIKEALETCILGYCTGCPYDGCDGDCRDELHKDVLTLITEQEIEIERLKANGYRSIMYAFDNNRDKIVENIQTEIDDYKQSIKQAKIDVLNEVKTNISKSDDFMDICSYHIDKLIKEIENDNRRN